MRRNDEVTPALLAQARAGSRRAVARLLTLVERSSADAEQVVRALYSATGRAHIVGITGSPGSGKSTVVNELARHLRAGDPDIRPQIGIIAVDPSSPFTGGALLGDRVRMRDLAGDPGIFIRSMASRGRLGGLAAATAAAVKVLDAAGFDLILVETVGAGQAEVDIAATAHTVLVIEAPGMGDDIQSIKAGILEIADVLVVNKADRANKGATVKALQMMLHLNPAGTRVRHHGTMMAVDPVPGSTDGAATGEMPVWETPLLETVATEGRGIPELAVAIERHRGHLRQTGEWQTRETDRSRQEIDQLLQERFMAHLRRAVPAGEREAVIAAVASRALDPYTAVGQLLATARLAADPAAGVEPE